MSNFNNFVKSKVENASQSLFDSYIEYNSNKKIKSGISMVFIRREIGSCCNWCKKIAGIYTADNRPDEFYQRHSNCRCMVTVRTEKGYQDAWSKKEFQTQKQARIQRESEILIEEEKYKKYEIQRRIAKSEKDAVIDTTKEWFERATPENVEIKEKKSVTIDGKKYEVGTKDIFINLQKHEKEALEMVAKTFGGEMIYMPVIKSPEGISTADCIFNGRYFDLKQCGLKNNNISGKNLLFNSICKKEKQAHCFILDLSRTSLTREQALEQARNIFTRRRTAFVEKIILMDDEVFAVLERP